MIHPNPTRLPQFFCPLNLQLWLVFHVFNSIIVTCKHRSFLPPHFKMSPAIQMVNSLVKDIVTLSKRLPASVLPGMKEDKIWAVMNADTGEMAHKTFNKQFDTMFGEDCWESNGHL